MLKNSGGSKEIFKKAMQLKATVRYFLPVLVIDKKQIKWWGFGKQLYSTLLSALCDPDYGIIFDYEQGRTITLTIAPPKATNFQYGKVDVRISPKQSSIYDYIIEDKLSQSIRELPDIKQIYKKSYNYDQKTCQERLEQWKNKS